MLNFPKTLAPVGGATDVCWLAGLIYAVWQVGTNVEVPGHRRAPVSAV